MQRSQDKKKEIKSKKFTKMHYFIMFLVLALVLVIMYEVNESIMMGYEEESISIKCSIYDQDRRDDCCSEELDCKNMTRVNGRYYGVFWEEDMLCGCLTKDESFNLISSLNCSEGLIPTFVWNSGRLSCENKSVDMI